MSRATWQRCASGALLAALVLGACGDDVPSRQDFVRQMQDRAEASPVPARVYGCTYDAIRKDQRLLQATMDNQGLSKQDNEKLATILSRCVLQNTTTTSRPGGRGD